MPFAAAEGDVEDEGDQVGLRLVGLAVSLDGSGDVEVAETGVAEAMDAIEPGEHLFDQQLALAVGVGGEQPGVFGDGGRFGLAVAGGGGAEDDAVVTGGKHRLEQGEGGHGVAAEVHLGDLHALARPR